MNKAGKIKSCLENTYIGMGLLLRLVHPERFTRPKVQKDYFPP
jgi:hypothetical protein